MKTNGKRQKSVIIKSFDHSKGIRLEREGNALHVSSFHFLGRQKEIPFKPLQSALHEYFPSDQRYYTAPVSQQLLAADERGANI